MQQIATQGTRTANSFPQTAACARRGALGLLPWLPVRLPRRGAAQASVVCVRRQQPPRSASLKARAFGASETRQTTGLGRLSMQLGFEQRQSTAAGHLGVPRPAVHPWLFLGLGEQHHLGSPPPPATEQPDPDHDPMHDTPNWPVPGRFHLTTIQVAHSYCARPLDTPPTQITDPLPAPPQQEEATGASGAPRSCASGPAFLPKQGHRDEAAAVARPVQYPNRCVSAPVTAPIVDRAFLCGPDRSSRPRWMLLGFVWNGSAASDGPLFRLGNPPLTIGSPPTQPPPLQR